MQETAINTQEDASPVPSLASLKKIFATSAASNFQRNITVKDWYHGGDFASNFKGDGLEFEHIRPYEPGDDVRHINWRVTAKSNVPQVKVFKIDIDRPIILFVEVSGAMQFATRGNFKSVLAAELTAKLAGIAYNSKNRFGGVLFGDKTDDYYLPPDINNCKIIDFFSRLCDLEKNNSTSLSLGEILRKMEHKLLSGSLIFIICDIWSITNNLTPILNFYNKKHNLVLLPIIDSIDCALPAVKFMRLLDQYGNKHKVSITSKLRTDYKRQWEQHIEQVMKLEKNTATTVVALNTNMTILNGICKLQYLLARRAGWSNTQN